MSTVASDVEDALLESCAPAVVGGGATISNFETEKYLFSCFCVLLSVHRQLETLRPENESPSHTSSVN